MGLRCLKELMPTIGKIFKFSVLEEDEMNLFCFISIKYCIYAMDYTQACENLLKSNGANKDFTFLGSFN